MKTFKFTSVRHIDAETEEEAQDIFADESWNFAAEADVEEVNDAVQAAQTVTLSKKTLDELLQHSVWLQQELLEKQDSATNETDAVWLANRIYEIEKVKEQARLETLESM